MKSIIFSLIAILVILTGCSEPADSPYWVQKYNSDAYFFFTSNPELPKATYDKLGIWAPDYYIDRNSKFNENYKPSQAEIDRLIMFSKKE